jgi:hypothetical protein
VGDFGAVIQNQSQFNTAKMLDEFGDSTVIKTNIHKDKRCSKRDLKIYGEKDLKIYGEKDLKIYGDNELKDSRLSTF